MSTGINIAPSSGITVGTTAVTSGTDGRVFFQAGGVVQQDGNFTYDNTLKRLGLKAVGTAATDIPLLIQDSAGTGKLFQATGDGKHSFNMSPNTNFSLSIDQTNQNGGLAVYSSGQAIFTVAKVAGSVGYISVLNNGNASFFSGTTSYFNHSLVVGGNSTSPGARLDVRAQGALSTDIAFRVRNSADTDNLIESAGNGLVKFRTGTERIEINTSASDYKISAYKFGVEMTKISTYSSYFCFGGTGQYLGIGTNAPSHLLDVNTIGSQKQVVARFGNEFNSTTQSDVVLKFTTLYSGGGSGGNPLAYLTVGNNGGVGLNNNARSYFKFELLRNNTLAERASITSQSNLLLQTPTEDTNDIGVIYIPNGTAPTVALAGGGKLYVEGGALKYIGSSGTISVIAPA
jgi:hypothetical protein